MVAELLCVGTELLMGHTLNTNASYISSRLQDIGIGVYYHSVVGDNPIRLRDVFMHSLSRSDVVILTGGLGPTQDDLTKETISNAMGLKLIYDNETLLCIESFFKKLNKEMTDNNKKQALFPEGCYIVRNSNGTAPGCIIEKDNKTVILLPGPPSEMTPMLEQSVLPYLEAKNPNKLVSKFIRVFGIGESAVEKMISIIIENQTNPTIAPYAKDGEVMLRVTASCLKEDNGDSLINPVIKKISDILGSHIYSIDGKNLEEVVYNQLEKSNTTFSFAESCTGGLLSHRFSLIPGVSKLFKGCVVAYANSVKTGVLDVNNKIIQDFGAVSVQTAEDMAKNIKRITGSEMGISVTGIAGPGGGTLSKPVGLVYIALAVGNHIESKEFKLWGSREKIINASCLNAMDMMRRYLLTIT